jgi:hypothetical protein
MLTGRPPYQGESAKAIMRAQCFEPVPDPAESNPEVLPPWRDLCLRMLAKAPDDRFAGAAELHAEVKAAVRWKPGTAPRARVGRGKAAAGAGRPWGAIILVSTLVLLVLGGLFYVGLRAPPSEAILTVGQPNPGEPVLARAKARLSALPEEPSAALPVVEALLADPSFAPARALILARRDALLATIEDRRRNALRATADMIEVKITAGDLGDARDELARLPEEAWLTDRRRGLNEQLTSAERVAENVLAASIDAAANAEGCDRLVSDIVRSGLPEGRRQALNGRLDRRRAELAPRPTAPATVQTPTPTPTDAALAWRELGERCEPQRAALPYSGLVEALRNGASGFSNEDRVQLETIATFVEAAQQAESALRLHLGQATPKAEGRLGNRSGTFVLTRLEKDWIGFRLPGVPAESRAERASAVMPWAQLLAGALSGPEAPRQAAAFLWHWRKPEARSALARLKDEALSTALANYERRARPLDITGEIERKAAGLFAVSYPFAAARETGYLEAWPGSGGELVERGLRWASATMITAGSGAESELPGLRWRTALKAPMTLEATVQPEPGSDVILVGITAGGLTVRVGLNPKRQGFYLATKTDGSGTYEALGSNPPPEYNPNDWSRIRLSVDAAGKLSAWLNDKPLTCDRALAFPTEAKLSPVIQGRPVKRGVGLVVSQLSVTGRL